MAPKVCYVRVYKDGKPSSGISVYIDGGLIGMTDVSGQVLMPADDLPHKISAGNKEVTIRKAEETRVFSITLDPTPAPVVTTPKPTPAWQFWKKSPTAATSSKPGKAWIKWVVFTILAVVALYLLLKPTPYDPSNPIPFWLIPTQAQPGVTLDVNSNATIKMIHILYVILLLGMLVAGWLNSRERQQTGDFYTAAISLLAVFLIFILKPIQLFVLTWFGFPLGDLNEKIIGFGVFTATVTAVTIVSLVGGRDFTAWGVFFGGLALGGALSGRLGVFSNLFQTGAKLVPLDQWWNFIIVKDYDSSRFTTIVVILFISSLVGYLIDLIKPDRKQTPAWGAVLVAAFSPILYIVVRNKLPQIPPWFTSITLIGIVAILATFSRKIGFGAANPSGNPNLGGIGQFITRPSWDVVGLFVVWGGLLLTLTGWV